MRELIGKRATHLYRGSFAPDGGAEQMRNHRAAQHHGHHAQGNDLFGVVDLVNDQVVAGLNGPAHA
ncbi:hypothetical protein D3C77_784060 [compost metagenome]